MTTFSKQAELDFMHNFRHDTEGDRWAKHEIEYLRQQVTLLREFVKLLRDYIPASAVGNTTVQEALAATAPKEFT